jgi:hypothetical protein
MLICLNIVIVGLIIVAIPSVPVAKEQGRATREELYGHLFRVMSR